MKSLIKIILVLATFFALTFIIANLTGIFSFEVFSYWLDEAKKINTSFLFLIVILLLFSDIFIAIPSLSVAILSGYFLGFPLGGLAASLGMLLAGNTGYFLSINYGKVLLHKIVPLEIKRNEAVETFHKYGEAMILLSRVSPILPEVSACLAGMTKMKYSKFITLWGINSIPYAFIAAYSGSISTKTNPQPAIYTAIGLYGILWLSWFLFRKYKKNQDF